MIPMDVVKQMCQWNEGFRASIPKIGFYVSGLETDPDVTGADCVHKEAEIKENLKALYSGYRKEGFTTTFKCPPEDLGVEASQT